MHFIKNYAIMVNMNSGIYQIKNTINGKCYIGSAVNLQQRLATHLSMLRHRNHYNIYLQRAFDKDDEEAFIFEVLEDVEPENLIKREQYYFDTLNPEYNISPTAGSTFGVPCSAEARARQSAAKMGERNPFYGRHHSEETRARQSAALTGKHPNAKTLTKMSAATTGERNPMYGRTGERNPNYGKHRSAETCAKISAANSGERHPNYGKSPSAETRTRQSKAMIGRHPSAETRAKMGRPMNDERNPMYGKYHSATTRAKISAAQKAYWRRKRAEDQ